MRFKSGNIVRVVRGPLGAYYSPDEDAWPHAFQTTVPTDAVGEIVGEHSLPGWYIMRVYDDSHGDTGNKFVPVGEGHITPA